VWPAFYGHPLTCVFYPGPKDACDPGAGRNTMAGMSETNVDVRAPSGRLVSITAGHDATVLGVNTSFFVASGKTSRVFMIGSSGYHDLACEVLVKATLAWRGYVSGYELVASVDDSGGVLITTLLGPHHELMTVFADGAPARGHVESIFASLVVEDLPEGMAVTPGNDAFSTIAWEDVSVIVDQRGALNIPDPTGAARLIPKWRGARTQKGELWRRSADEGSSDQSMKGTSYILGCPRGVAEVHISPRTSAGRSELLGWLDTLEITWH
jgi:hypothetical protein